MKIFESKYNNFCARKAIWKVVCKLATISCGFTMFNLWSCPRKFMFHNPILYSYPLLWFPALWLYLGQGRTSPDSLFTRPYRSTTFSKSLTLKTCEILMTLICLLWPASGLVYTWNWYFNWEACHAEVAVISCLKVIPHSGCYMMTSSNGNIFRVTGHLCGEFTGRRTKASDAELCFLWSAPE